MIQSWSQMANNQKYSTLVILEKQLDGKKTQDEDLSTLVIPRARNMDGTTPMLPRRSGWQISDNVK